MNENEDMTAPRYGGGERFYYRYEEEHSQRYLEGSRLHLGMTGGAGKAKEEEKREGKQTKKGAEDQEIKISQVRRTKKANGKMAEV